MKWDFGWNKNVLRKMNLNVWFMELNGVINQGLSVENVWFMCYIKWTWFGVAWKCENGSFEMNMDDCVDLDVAYEWLKMANDLND